MHNKINISIIAFENTCLYFDIFSNVHAIKIGSIFHFNSTAALAL